MTPASMKNFGKATKKRTFSCYIVTSALIFFLPNCFLHRRSCYLIAAIRSVSNSQKTHLRIHGFVEAIELLEPFDLSPTALEFNFLEASEIGTTGVNMVW